MLEVTKSLWLLIPRESISSSSLHDGVALLSGTSQHGGLTEVSDGHMLLSRVFTKVKQGVIGVAAAKQ